jgi:hypothetical protein
MMVPTVKSVRLSKTIAFLPNAFDAAANTGWHTAELSRNAVPVQYACIDVACTEAAMIERATESAVESTAAM